MDPQPMEVRPFQPSIGKWFCWLVPSSGQSKNKVHARVFMSSRVETSTSLVDLRALMGCECPRTTSTTTPTERP